jgi:hypothetical protein
MKKMPNIAPRWFLAWCIPQDWRWRRQVPPKHWLTFNELHSIIFQMTEPFRYLRFEVFTVVIMKNGVFWDVTP